MNKNWLLNKVVIISGASGGLGFALSKYLIETFDCKIIAIARNKEKIEKAIQTLSKKENFSYYLFDVSINDNWKNFTEQLVKDGIKPDVLINNAGFMLDFNKFENYTETEIDQIIDTNFKSYLYGTKALLPLIKNSSTPAIINVISAAGLCPVVGQSLYTATKFALTGFTKTLYQEYKKKIYIAGIYPGFIKTDILNNIKLSKKNAKLVNRYMMPLDKATVKIVKKIRRKKKKIVLGLDGHAMSFFGRTFPNITPDIISGVLKASKLEMFEKIFDCEVKK